VYKRQHQWGAGLGLAPAKPVAAEVVDNDPPTPV
jgi:hypothetical protein